MGDQDEIAALRAELRTLQDKLARLESATEPTAGRVDRRGMLRHLGTAAAGAAVGGLAFARPAAAADDDNIVIGNAAQTAQSPTALVTSAGYGATPSVGAFHVTDNIGVTDINAAASCISAAATGTRQTVAFFGSGSSVGAKLNGPVPLKLLDNTGSAAPTSAGGTAGMFKQVGGDLWYCAKSAPNAVWRLLATAAATPPDGSAGKFFAITPARAYDSRLAGAGGPIANTQSRVVSVANGIDSTGAVVAPDVVPAGATAISFNITVTQTTGGFNYLSVNPGDAASFTASTINWSAANTTIANGGVVKLDGSRQVKVFCGDAGTPGTTQFIVDVTGYYL